MSDLPTSGTEATVKLKRGKEGPIRAGHPWIFSGAIAAFSGAAEPGAVVRIEGADSKPMGVGLYNPNGSIAVRVLSGQAVPSIAALVERRISDALAMRRGLGLVHEDSAYRLLNGEGDGLPGVVADVYGKYVVVQLLNAGADRLRAIIFEALAKELSPQGIFERSTGGARREEGLADRAELAFGNEPPEHVAITENGVRHLVDLRRGQKTGFFLDQRDNRALVARLSGGLRVLDCFSYTGGFALSAEKGGADQVRAVETSGPALEIARAAAEAGGVDASRIDFRMSDVFDALQPVEPENRPELIILDPPPFARHRADRDRATRAYRDLNRKALRALAEGGMMMTFSCSPHMTRDVFVHVVATSAPAGHRLQILAQLGAGADHPTLPAHPEGEYLCGLLVRCVRD
ncbi:MAG: class I SAM-dependent rRNA methyltransferase [Candidatus Binatia bacterium]|nr:class I SAM-dependent rRNA methyltransferase [Candidatus Binatia bacterium]